jgi:flagella basal body P-ring formation protein FlgA
MATQLTPDRVLASLSADLKARFNLEGDLQIDFANAWLPPAGSSNSWKVAILEYPSVAGSSMIVRFRVQGDSDPFSDSTVILRAALWRDAWFAREPLAQGTTLDSPLLEPRRVDGFRMRDSISVGTTDADLIVTRTVQAGDMLSWHDMGHRPLVHKGELVDVSACTGMLRVTMKGVALKDGALGEIVTVRNPESLKTIPAMVVGDNRVEIHL